MVKVMIADDHALIRRVVREVVEKEDDLEIIAEARDGIEAAEQAIQTQPDVVLMAIRMPKLDGLAAPELLRAQDEPPEVIVLTTFEADDYVLRALRAGASGFLLKDTPPSEVVRAVRVIAAGDPMLSPAVTRRLIGHIADRSANDRQRNARGQLDSLSQREREVAIAIGLGKSNAEISGELYMSVATVKAHVSRILEKLALNNRVQVALLAHDAGEV